MLNAPPVPRLPDKGLPALPGAGPSHARERYSADDPRAQQQQRPVGAMRGKFSPTHKKRKKGSAASLEPPELVFIPKLLPLFLEMVSTLPLIGTLLDTNV